MSSQLGMATIAPVSNRIGRLWGVGGNPVAPPLDIASMPTPLFAISTRKLSSSYAGKCLRLRRSSDAAQSDFGFNSDGELDEQAVAAWLGSANGTVVKWYDQSGNGRDFVAGVSVAPLYRSDAQNGKPGILFDNTNDIMFYQNSMTGLSSIITSVVFRSSNSTVVPFSAASNSVDPYYFFFYYTPGTLDLVVETSGGTLSASASVSTGNFVGHTHLLFGEILEGVGANLYLDSASLDGSESVSSWANINLKEYSLLGNIDGGVFINGYMFEIIQWPVQLIESIRIAFEANTNAYWSIY